MITRQYENKAHVFRGLDRKLVYIGEGIVITGIPPRDLTAAEVDKFGGIDALIETGLYARPEDIERDGG